MHTRSASGCMHRNLVNPTRTFPLSNPRCVDPCGASHELVVLLSLRTLCTLLASPLEAHIQNPVFSSIWAGASISFKLVGGESIRPRSQLLAAQDPPFQRVVSLSLSVSRRSLCRYHGGDRLWHIQRYPKTLRRRFPGKAR